MKKVLIFLVLIMAVMVVNAQVTNTADSTTRKTVKLADLPKALTDNITKDYAGYTIKEATSVTENNVVTYEIVVVKGVTTETLVYDKDGVFIKKLPPVEMKK